MGKLLSRFLGLKKRLAELSGDGADGIDAAAELVKEIEATMREVAAYLRKPKTNAAQAKDEETAAELRQVRSDLFEMDAEAFKATETAGTSALPPAWRAALVKLVLRLIADLLPKDAE